MDVGAGGYVYEATAAAQAVEGGGSAQDLGACFTSAAVDAQWQPYPWELDCAFGAGSTTGTSVPVRKLAVNAALELNQQRPLYGFSIAEPIVDLSSGVDFCNIYVDSVTGTS